MRIKRIESEAADLIPYITASSGGQGIVQAQFPVYYGVIEGLPASVDALIVTSDLQGVVEEPGGSKLLGEVTPELLKILLSIDRPDIDPDRVVVLLCGDLYADPEKRGGGGDPCSVWTAFRQIFGTVAGVAGNHDLFNDETKRLLAESEQVYFFEEPDRKSAAEIDLAGLGGIIGRSDKPNRMTERDYLLTLKRLLRKKPDLLLLHQGPEGGLSDQMGHAGIRSALEAEERTLVFCGHVHWERHIAELSNGTQICNADGKVFIFTR
ncbi:metallophosphoesterase family protein [Paenibacillus macquariensis]|uniref:Calcineurin-like phosphoesterase n=1 Tax=Paenibacillus macquariensis TaxID=948756 RepID=A0ABY1JV80_9BACL|nr:metallophosphoesterase [Paenibacillus macquariensis]MEC0090829.1 metallophosphoesterase [Paenibacillus macquariensis]OAB34571.1 hypothetical protein PMSM_11960 [Paenibacillus macquariensis subsp. macquariensis]SIQ82615.1 Calcineurin-like phosphoesterase [Paenibacillus macquariensis]